MQKHSLTFFIITTHITNQISRNYAHKFNIDDIIKFMYFQISISSGGPKHLFSFLIQIICSQPIFPSNFAQQLNIVENVMFPYFHNPRAKHSSVFFIIITSLPNQFYSHFAHNLNDNNSVIFRCFTNRIISGA